MATPLPVWTVKIGDVTKSFAELKLCEPEVTFASQQRDVFTLVQKMAVLEEAELFAYGADVRIYRNLTGSGSGTQFFRGRVVTRRKVLRTETECVQYEIAGAWWYFEKVVYNQIWKSWVTGTTFTNFYSSLVLLNVNTLGAKRTTGQQITDAINYAISESGIPITLGTITPNFDVPIDEKQDITVAEVIRLMLRWHPKAVCWFDYSTDSPTFHCRLHSELEADEHEINGKPHRGSEITRREDMVIPSCCIRYRITGTNDGAGYRVIDERKHPPGSTGRELGALCMTIDVAGSNTTSVKGSIETEPIEEHEEDWWRYRCKKLADENITNLVLSDVMVVEEDSGAIVIGPLYPNRLVKGTIANWMNFYSAKIIISAKASYDYMGVGYVIEKVVGETVYVQCTGTDGETGDYSRLSEFEEGEAVPVGLEQTMYDEINGAPLYEGSVTFKEREATGLVSMGRNLNLIGADPEWETMNALVQSVHIVINSGETSCTLGVPEHLSAGDLIELLRVNRVRRRFTLVADRTEGSSGGGGGDVELGDYAANDASDHTGSQKAVVRSQRNPAAPTGFEHTVNALTATALLKKGTFTIDDGLPSPAQTVMSGPTIAMARGSSTVNITIVTGRQISFREWRLCVDGVQKRAIVLASDFY